MGRVGAGLPKELQTPLSESPWQRITILIPVNGIEGKQRITYVRELEADLG
jgi:hypothetical protein